jgi:hypothetical protein
MIFISLPRSHSIYLCLSHSLMWRGKKQSNSCVLRLVLRQNEWNEMKISSAWSKSNRETSYKFIPWKKCLVNEAIQAKEMNEWKKLRDYVNYMLMMPIILHKLRSFIPQCTQFEWVTLSNLQLFLFASFYSLFYIDRILSKQYRKRRYLATKSFI